MNLPEPVPGGAALRAARVGRGWSQSEAAREIAGLGHRRGVPVAAAASLKTLLSRWENGHVVPEPQYRELLAELFGRTAGELGIDPEAQPVRAAEGAERLRAALAGAAAADHTVVALWREQLAVAGRLDDELGTAGAGALVRAQVAQLHHTLAHTLGAAARQAVASVLSGAAALAGAQHLDAGEPDLAWEAYRRAHSAAAVARRPVAAATALAGQATVLVEVGEPGPALVLLGDEPPGGPPGATARWSAAVGLARAAGGQAPAAQAAFGRAEEATRAAVRAAVVPDMFWPSTIDVELDDLHRRRGHALSLLGDPAAFQPLTGALAAGPTSARHRGELHADLAVTVAARDPNAAAAHARQARAIATRIGSRRIPARLDGAP
ncbi:helix-turn-helix transcriptional regulator [Pseudonocardia sp. 73-21]|uniref:helix-turn-helix domain-containing protein n=1 Tax=Pseudonocardia sp. 73-21 TaxID=1895809 RepID=UPI00095E0DB7|nr:helix-turn-helix transcriptional regulator [Pseudonocardia sp. 73-21]OJY48959.1 MAG: hypothetical protein BGP03_09325 [Pseudonocardia sp. 73-21]